MQHTWLQPTKCQRCPLVIMISKYGPMYFQLLYGEQGKGLVEQSIEKLYLLVLNTVLDNMENRKIVPQKCLAVSLESSNQLMFSLQFFLDNFIYQNILVLKYQLFKINNVILSGQQLSFTLLKTTKNTELLFILLRKQEKSFFLLIYSTLFPNAVAIVSGNPTSAISARSLKLDMEKIHFLFTK